MLHFQTRTLIWQNANIGTVFEIISLNFDVVISSNMSYDGAEMRKWMSFKRERDEIAQSATSSKYDFKKYETNKKATAVYTGMQFLHKLVTFTVCKRTKQMNNKRRYTDNGYSLFYNL